MNSLKQQYEQLYGMMATSSDPKNMRLFGETMTDMFDWMVENKPALAQQIVEKLESMKWKQYLTKDEAEDTIEHMDPKAPWNYPTWENVLQSLGLATEHEPVFNRYALWTVMNAMYSDHGNTLANIMNTSLTAIPTETLVPAIHALAIDMLTDKDGKYNVRKYFLTK